MPHSKSGFFLEKKVPLALLLTLFLQAGAAVWWAASKDMQDRTVQARLVQMESGNALENARTLDVLQRLSRLEAYAEEQKASLRRIESVLSRKAP